MKIEKRIKIKNKKEIITKIYKYEEWDENENAWIKCRAEVTEEKNKENRKEIIIKIIIGTMMIGVGLYQMLNISFG